MAFMTQSVAGGNDRQVFDDLRSKIQFDNMDPKEAARLINQSTSLSDKSRNDLLNLLASQNRAPGAGAGVGGGGVFVPGVTGPGGYGIPPGAGVVGPGGPGGTAGPPQNIYGQLNQEWQQKNDEAKAANEARYQEIVSGHIDRYGNAMNTISQANQQGQQDIREAGANRLQNIGQGLVSSGLYNTTAGLAPKAMAIREEEGAINHLNTATNEQKLRYGANLHGDLLGFKERREDTYPDMNQLASLQQGLGASGYSGAAYAPGYAQSNVGMQPAGPVGPPTRPVRGQRPGVPTAPPYGGLTRPMKRPVSAVTRPQTGSYGYSGRPGI